jgi:hypothetical protein
MNHPIHPVVTLPLKADSQSIMGNLFICCDVINTVCAQLGEANTEVVGSVLTDF